MCKCVENRIIVSDFSFSPADIYLGISVDEVLYISYGDDVIGVCGITYMENPEELYLEWVELYAEYAGQHRFRPALTAIAKHFNAKTLIFETNEDNKPIYDHLGAEETDYDDFRKMWEYRLPVDVLLAA